MSTAADTSPTGARVVIEARRARPALWWAAIGGLFVALALYIFGSWIASDDFTRTKPGPDKLGTSTKIFLQGFQWLSVVMAVLIVVIVVRQSRRERRLSFDAMLVIAWVSVYWQDPLINYARTGFFYNSHFVNFGSWTEHIPGWMSPNGHLLPEPLAFVGALYFWLGPAASLLTFWVMRRAKARRPELGVLGLLATAWLVMVVLDLFAELIWVRTNLYAYSGTVHGLSIWGGHRFQFPLYESVLWPMMWTAMGALKYFRDDRGRTVVERGIDQVRAVRSHATLRTLAIVGFANVAMIIYTIPMVFMSLHNDATPTGYPSYMTNGMCGPGTKYACNGPDVPIPLPHSKAVPPEGGPPR